jgi:hypothetical protein
LILKSPEQKGWEQAHVGEHLRNNCKTLSNLSTTKTNEKQYIYIYIYIYPDIKISLIWMADYMTTLYISLNNLPSEALYELYVHLHFFTHSFLHSFIQLTLIMPLL